MKSGKVICLGWLWLECLLLFGGIPLLLTFFQLRGGIPFFPVLFGLLLVTLLLGALQPGFRFRESGAGARARARLPRLLLRLAAAALLLTAYTVWRHPELLFRLPRERPHLWGLVMLLYPLLSVAPQEFLFRTFFFQRYRPLFGDGTGMRWANALAFGWAHVFFLNWTAPLLSLLGGLLLAETWQRSRSFRLVCFEHALYGQIVFTCGLGWFFYNGSARALQSVLP